MSTARNNHSVLIEIMKKLGYSINARGMCHGITLMATQACITGDIDTFNERIDFIISGYESLPNEGFIGLALDPKLAEELVNGLGQKFIDVIAFFDGIELFQRPYEHTELFNRSLAQTDRTFISTFTTSIKLEKLGGLVNPMSWSGLYNTEELHNYFRLLNEIATSIKQPFSLLLSSDDHTIGLHYDPNLSSGWYVIDANRLPIQTIQIIDLAAWVEYSFNTSDITAFETRIFLPGNAKEITEKLDNAIKLSNEFTELHQITNKKAGCRNENDCTLLYIAVKNNHVDTVNALIEAGADVNAQNKSGYSPIFSAAQNGFVDILNHLIKAGADVNAPNKFGYTAICVAARLGYTDVVKALILGGANIHTKTGNSPISIAVQYGHASVLRALVDAGVDLELETRFDRLLKMAKENGQKDCVDFLEECISRKRKDDELADTFIAWLECNRSKDDDSGQYGMSQYQNLMLAWLYKVRYANYIESYDQFHRVMRRVADKGYISSDFVSEIDFNKYLQQTLPTNDIGNRDRLGDFLNSTVMIDWPEQQTLRKNVTTVGQLYATLSIMDINKAIYLLNQLGDDYLQQILLNDTKTVDKAVQELKDCKCDNMVPCLIAILRAYKSQRLKSQDTNISNSFGRDTISVMSACEQLENAILHARPGGTDMSKILLDRNLTYLWGECQQELTNYHGKDLPAEARSLAEHTFNFQNKYRVGDYGDLTIYDGEAVHRYRPQLQGTFFPLQNNQIAACGLRHISIYDYERDSVQLSFRTVRNNNDATVVTALPDNRIAVFTRAKRAKRTSNLKGINDLNDLINDLVNDLKNLNDLNDVNYIDIYDYKNGKSITITTLDDFKNAEDLRSVLITDTTSFKLLKSAAQSMDIATPHYEAIISLMTRPNNPYNTVEDALRAVHNFDFNQTKRVADGSSREDVLAVMVLEWLKKEKDLVTEEDLQNWFKFSDNGKYLNVYDDLNKLAQCLSIDLPLSLSQTAFYEMKENYVTTAAGTNAVAASHPMIDSLAERYCDWFADGDTTHIFDSEWFSKHTSGELLLEWLGENDEQQIISQYSDFEQLAMKINNIINNYEVFDELDLLLDSLAHLGNADDNRIDCRVSKQKFYDLILQKQRHPTQENETENPDQSKKKSAGHHRKVGLFDGSQAGASDLDMMKKTANNKNKPN